VIAPEAKRGHGIPGNLPLVRCPTESRTSFEALRRFSVTLPRLAGRTAAAVAATTLSLHEAQLVTAREAGFSSWPKLKAHIESLAVSRALGRYTLHRTRTHPAGAAARRRHLNRILARSGLTPEGIRNGIEGRIGPRDRIQGAVEIG
jgi:hypothetical protein